MQDSEVEEEDDEDIINGSMSECSAELLVMSELNFIRNKLRVSTKIYAVEVVNYACQKFMLNCCYKDIYLCVLSINYYTCNG